MLCRSDGPVRPFTESVKDLVVLTYDPKSCHLKHARDRTDTARDAHQLRTLVKACSYVKT